MGGGWGKSRKGEGEWEVRAAIYGMRKSQDKRHRVGTIANDVVIALYGERW